MQQVIAGLVVLTVLRLGIPIAVIFGISALLGRWNTWVQMNEPTL